MVHPSCVCLSSLKAHRGVRLEVLQYDRRGQGILLKLAVIKMSNVTIKVKKVKMATKSCPECDQQVRFCLSMNDIFVFLLVLNRRIVIFSMVCALTRFNYVFDLCE